MGRASWRGQPRRGVATRTPRGGTLPATFLARVVALAATAVIGSGWALVRYYTHPRAPMRVPVDAGAWDAGPGFVPAPELEIAP